MGFINSSSGSSGTSGTGSGTGTSGTTTTPSTPPTVTPKPTDDMNSVEADADVTVIDKPNPIPATTIPEAIPKEQETIPSPEEKLVKTQFIIDTFHNATAVNTSRAAQVVADLKGYGEGSTIQVTYYMNSAPETNSKGIAREQDMTVSDVHKSQVKIHGFELRMLGSLNYEHNTDDSISKLSGEALTYPGFVPRQGDKFIMEIEAGTFGEMEVKGRPVRTAIKSSTYYKIAFELIHWMNPQREAALESFVRSEAWFDKKRFLNEPGALLYHNEFVEMKFMELQSAQMVTYYNAKFLDRKLMFSFMRPDSVYDPYVTDFMMKITDFNEAGLVAAQLFKDAPCMETSIWRALLSETVPLQIVPTGSTISTHTLGSKTVIANSLLNRDYVSWDESSDSLFKFFAEEDESASTTTTTTTTPTVSIADMTDEEGDKLIGDLLLHIHPHYAECVVCCCGDCNCCGDTVCDVSNGALAILLDGSANWKSMIRLFLRERRVNVDLLHKCIASAYELEPIQQFYKIPVLIFLARTAVRYLHGTAGIFE